jgi:hypothetical protein
MMNSAVPPAKDSGRLLTVLLWLSLTAGCVISVLSLIEELCLVQACRDTLSFTLFGVGLGWVGAGYFGGLLMLLALRTRFPLLGLLLAAMVFAGIGAEFRLLWIQKFIIGAWCPFCVSIACTVFTAAFLLLLETLRAARAQVQTLKYLTGWLALMSPMAGFGLAAAYLFIRQLS